MSADGPDPRLVQKVAERIFSRSVALIVERVPEGVSTSVYRVRRGAETFYLRVLPEVGASFAPEAFVHRALRGMGLKVPEVVHFEHENPFLQRSVMVTTAIAGAPVGQRQFDQATRDVLREAGRSLAILNRLPVAGFGWIRRPREDVIQLEGEHASFRAFACESFDADLAALAGTLLDADEIRKIQTIVEGGLASLDTAEAWLAHGDFDMTHIYQLDGRFTGLIDFGEIRGAQRWYDLGHFRLHDGETLPRHAFPDLLEGYADLTPLPADHDRLIALSSLWIGIRALARSLRKPPGPYQAQLVRAIRREIARLWDES